MFKDEETIDPSQTGKGNWSGFDIPMDKVREAAAEWRLALAGVTRPWLCWNVSDRWCKLQQRLIQEVGWTPVIGFDPRSGPPTVLPGSILIDFNSHFGLGVMWPHFPLEFAFLFADRLAFWHADLLCRLEVMDQLASIFESLPDGAVAAVPDLGGRRNLMKFRHHRYWELVGCTTKSASESQFDHGSGWWRCINKHPQCKDDKERRRRDKYYYDSGVGIMYWKRQYGGQVINIPSKLVGEGHCTSINRKNYRQMIPGGARNLGAEIDLNFDIEKVAAKLGIAHLL
ncbi:MAG: hypothetical protein M3O31_11400 [Acidobacteriota bacterium]|nr:hypothetical protein [Acidobacteriota bacterium]